MSRRRFVFAIPCSASAMSMMLLVLGMTMLSGSAASTADTPDGDERSRFRFEFEQTESHRGVGGEGWVDNGLPWRATTFGFASIASTRTGPLGSGTGWVLGGMSAGGRGYFCVPVASPAAAHRVSVQSFDKVAPLQTS